MRRNTSGLHRPLLALFSLLGPVGCDELLPLPVPTSPGTHDRFLDHDGLRRGYKLHIPPSYDGTESVPLVFMLHGGTGNVDQAARAYHWLEKADERGFIVVFPQGVGRAPTWNAVHCCGTALRHGVDDVGFIAVLIDELSTALAIDPKRIYATGMSNGGMMCHRLAAERADLFAAIAPVAATIGGQVDANAPVEYPPTPTGPMPVVMFNGTDDHRVPYDGGPSEGLTPGRIDLSVEESVQFWVSNNACNPTPSEESNAAGTVVTKTYLHTGNGADVVLYTIVGGGHAWPGARPNPLGAAIGLDPPTHDISATDAIWDFFAAHPKP